MSEELSNKIRLNQARIASSKKENSSKNKEGSSKKETDNKIQKFTSPVAAAKKAKDVITAPTAIKGTDIAIYGIAFSLAALKDLLDLVGIGSLPAIGTVITFCISIAIGFVLLFDNVSVSGRRVVRNSVKKWLVLIAGTIVEGLLFGLNFLPIEFFTVVVIYWMSLVDRKAR